MIEYDIAISFAGEDREIAHLLAKKLYINHGLSVFYDDYEQAKLLGKNLTEYLIDIYMNKASYCIILISQSYKEKRWTLHEWRAAQARALEEPDSDYIIPLRIDESDLPGLLPTVSYLKVSTENIENVASVIFNKVSKVVNLNHIVTKARRFYDNGNFSDALNLLNYDELCDDIRVLQIKSDIWGSLGDYENAIKCLLQIKTKRSDDFLTNFHLGIYYFRIMNFEKSIFYFKEADKISPGHPTIITDLPASIVWKRLSKIPLIGSILTKQLKKKMEMRRKKLLKCVDKNNSNF